MFKKSELVNSCDENGIFRIVDLSSKPATILFLITLQPEALPSNSIGFTFLGFKAKIPINPPTV